MSGLTVKQMRERAVAELRTKVEGVVTLMDADTARSFEYADCSDKGELLELFKKAQKWLEAKVASLEAQKAAYEAEKAACLAASARRSEKTIMEHVLQESVETAKAELAAQQEEERILEQVLRNSVEDSDREKRLRAVEARLSAAAKRGAASAPLPKALVAQRDAAVLAAWRD